MSHGLLLCVQGLGLGLGFGLGCGVTQVSGVCGPPQMMSTDKDFCFMATKDLMMELQMDSINLMRVNRRNYRQVLSCRLVFS